MTGSASFISLLNLVSIEEDDLTLFNFYLDDHYEMLCLGVEETW